MNAPDYDSLTREQHSVVAGMMREAAGVRQCAQRLLELAADRWIHGHNAEADFGKILAQEFMATDARLVQKAILQADEYRQQNTGEQKGGQQLAALRSSPCKTGAVSTRRATTRSLR